MSCESIHFLPFTSRIINGYIRACFKKTSRINYRAQLIRNTAWTLTDLGLYPLLMVMATPLFINKLGASQYGLWMLVNTFVQGIHFLNFGVGDSTIRQVSHLRGKGVAALRQVVTRNMRLAALICLAGTVLGYLAGHSEFFLSQVNLSGYRSRIATLLLFGSITGGLKFFELVALGYYKGCERFDIAARLSLLSRCSVVLVNMGLVLSGYTLEALFRSMALTALANVLIQYGFMFYVTRPQAGSETAPADVTEPRHYFWYWLQSAIALASFLSDKVLVAHFTNLETLGYYSIASLVGIQIHNMLLSLGAFVFPRISFLQARGIGGHDVERIASFMLNTFGWLMLGTLLLSGGTLFNWWLGESTAMAALPYIRLYLVYECATILIIVPYHFLNGTEHIRWNTLFEVFRCSSQIIGMVIGHHLVGSTGILWGLIIATLCNLPFQYFVFGRVVLREKNHRWMMVNVVPLLFVTLLVVQQPWFMALLAGLIVTCVYLLYYRPAKHVLQQLRHGT